MKAWVVISMVTFCVVVGEARGTAAGLKDLQDGWLLGVEGMWRLFQPVHMNGLAGPGTPDGVWLSAGQCRLFGMAALPVVELAVGARHNRSRWTWYANAHWQRLGRDLFREDSVTLHVGGGRRWLCGAMLSKQAVTVAGLREANEAQAALEIETPPLWVGAARLRISGRFHLLEPPEWYGKSGRRELLRAIIEWPGLAVAAALDRLSDGAPRFSLDVWGRLSERMAVGVRLDPATGVMGPGLAVLLPRMLLRTSHVAHPELGPTHRFCLTVGSVAAAPRR